MPETLEPPPPGGRKGDLETGWQAGTRAWRPSGRVFLPSGRALERTGLSEEGRGPGPLEGFPAVCRAPRPGALSRSMPCGGKAEARAGGQTPHAVSHRLTLGLHGAVTALRAPGTRGNAPRHGHPSTALLPVGLRPVSPAAADKPGGAGC